MNRSAGVKLIPLLLILLVTACAPAPAAVPTSAVPAETTALLPSSGVVASAIVVPEFTSQLSFVIPGTLKELAVKEGDIVQAGQTLAVLYAPELEFAASQAEASARAAEFRYQYWIPARLNRPPERRQLAEQVFIQSQKMLETARAGLTQTTMKAPFDGTVVSLEAVPGEMIQSGQVIMTLASLDALRVETTDLSERDLPSVRVGQPATVFVEALGSQFTGKVIAISPIADRLGGDVVFKVTIELDSPPAELRWGMTAEVNIDTR